MNSVHFTRSNTIWLIGLTTIGFFLRVYALGDLGFRWDEDLTAIAVKAVKEHGYPLLDSGMVYPRFLPVQYLLAAWTSLVGFTESSIRFPIVLFGTALIPLTYILARDVVGVRVALIAAALMALDFWQIELARTARNYAPFFVVYALFVVAVYRGYLDGHRVWRNSILPIGLLAILIHDVGLFCAGIVLIPALLVPQVRSMIGPYAISLSLLAFMFASIKFSDVMWSLSMKGPTAAVQAPELYLADSSRALQSFLQDLGGVLHIPYFPLVQGMLYTMPGAVIWLLTIVIALALVAYLFRHDAWWLRALATVAVTAALLHQFTVAGIAWVVFVAFLLQGVRGFADRRALRLTSLLVVLFLYWLVHLPIFGYGVEDAKFVIRDLFDYPRFSMTMAYPINRPLMSLFALIGAAVLFDRCARPVPDRRSLFLLLTFTLSYFGTGVFAYTYSHFRYVQHADVFFMVIAAVGVLGVLSRLLGAMSARPAIAMVSTVLLTLVIVNPVRAVLAVTRDYSADSRLERWMNIGGYPDYKTTSAYIIEHREAGDQVLVLEPREYYAYLGKIDGWVRSGHFAVQVVYWDGVPHDKYIGAPLIQDVEALRRTIETHSGRTWLPFDSRLLESGPSRGVNEEIVEYLRANRHRQVMTGRDGARIVYLFDSLE